ncbi:MAG: tRNA uridine-5-carboxymethylaminomethyl(34) synthesis GTPase MnmE, partial [Bacteroidota bacterium]
MHTLPQNQPIVALATPPGKSAIAVIRLSGHGTLPLVNTLFSGKDLTSQPSHTVHWGHIVDTTGQKVLDEVLVTIFKRPHSFTKEDSVEIACHGSMYIVRQVIHLLIHQGARMAKPGEFTQKAFLNGRFDLAQAEAVADLIAAESEAAHQAAWQQMRGGFSHTMQDLRTQLIHLGALVELELDFSEEDVTFADRSALQTLVVELLDNIAQLIESFRLGNVIKNGVPTALVGKPNAGKSTLFNALLNEEKAITSPIPGTTRDLIEEEIHLAGIRFRFIDTAGLREETDDALEAMGMSKTKACMQRAALIIYVFDLSTASADSIQETLQTLSTSHTPCVKVGNKLDIAPPKVVQALAAEDFVLVSAAKKQNLDTLQKHMLAALKLDTHIRPDSVVVNARHYEQL